MSHPEMAFFNRLSGRLVIELTEPAQRLGNLDNEVAPPAARVATLRLEPELFEEEQGAFRELTPDELASTAFRGDRIKLRGESEDTVVHEAPNGVSFTVAELLAAVEETERRTRDRTEWFGGVDVHHRFFEGLHQADDGVWEIFWGS